jgi:hypothetical protein
MGALDDLAKPAGEYSCGPAQKWSAAHRISNVNENENENVNENEKTLLKQTIGRRLARRAARPPRGRG